MAFFAQHCPNGLFGQQPAAQLPWFLVVTLLTKLASPTERDWYAQQTVLLGWSRSTLEQNIKNRLQQRQGAQPRDRSRCEGYGGVPYPSGGLRLSVGVWDETWDAYGP